jgi:hypothetical protein
MSMSARELELAKRAARRLRERQRPGGELVSCPNCGGHGQIQSGVAVDGPESHGEGHACFAPCAECGGTGKGDA